MSFGSTLTGGIQDISAFLPILGTDQCESHIGQALTEGYLYAAATPLSLFGCLGIVKATIGILLASIQIGPLNGAKILRKAGFQLQGPCAAMIGATSEDPNDQYIEYAAESQFLALVSKLNIRTSKLRMWTVTQRWNIRLAFVTSVLSTLAITPYLPIIIRRPNFDNLFYPILRIVGSIICVVVSQFLLQIRIAKSLETLAENLDLLRWNKEGVPGWLFRILLAVGCCATAVGYVGCFTVVQGSNFGETLLWLGLEALLSLLRLWLWGLNPKFDDGTHIYIWVSGSASDSAQFSVTQATTGLRYKEDIVGSQKPFLVIRDRKFLRDMRAMLQTPSHPQDSPSWHPSRVQPYVDPNHYQLAVSYAIVSSDNGLYLLTSVIDLAENAAFVLTQKSGSSGDDTVCHSAVITTSLADGSMYTRLADLRPDALTKFRNLCTHSQRLINLVGAPDLHIKAAKVTWTGEMVELQQRTDKHWLLWARMLSALDRY